MKTLRLFGRRGEKLTSLVKAPVSVDDDLSFRARSPVGVGSGGRGRDSRDGLAVEWPVRVVGAVDASSEDSEMVDSSKLRPTIAGCLSFLDGRG